MIRRTCLRPRSEKEMNVSAWRTAAVILHWTGKAALSGSIAIIRPVEVFAEILRGLLL